MGRQSRISCHAASDMAACAAFRKESRMKLANATKLDRKSGAPGFPATLHRIWPRVRLSVKKAA